MYLTDIFNIYTNTCRLSHLVALKFTDLCRHEVVEMRVISIHRTVDTHCDIVLAHFIQQRRYPRARQMRRSPRYYRAHVSHVLAILVADVSYTQFGQHVSTVRVLSFGVAEIFRRDRSRFFRFGFADRYIDFLTFQFLRRI